MGRNSSSLSCLSCLCSCILVAVNNLTILIGAVFTATGVVLSFGMSWVVNNASVTNLLSELSKMIDNYIKADVNIIELAKNLNSITGSVGVAFIVIGAILLLISFLGCCGSCCKIKPCLIIYVGMVGALFLAQLTVVIIWYADSNILKSGAKGAMEGSVKRYTGLRSSNVESLLQNLLQIYLGCCGVNNGSDYDSLNTHWDREFTLQTEAGQNFTFNLTYPVTCCQFNLATLQPQDQFCPYNNTNSNYMRGCYSGVFGLIERHFLNYLFPALAGALGVQLLLVLGALIIYCAESPDKGNRVRPI